MGDFNVIARKKIIVFDIDGVLAKLKQDFEYTHDGSEDVVHITRLILSLLFLHKEETTIQVVLLTGRDETSRGMTENWLSRYGIEYSELLMRHPSLKNSNADYKLEVLRKLSFDSDIMGVIDDNPAMVEVCRLLCIPFFLFSNNS